jgi:hypothetical protein
MLPRSRIALAATASTLFATSAVMAGIQTFQPLTSFAGDGWLAPGENASIPFASDNQRGLAVNPVNGNVYLATRGTAAVQILNGNTGALSGGLDVSTVTGGTVNLTSLRTAADGSIYATNLTAGRSLGTASSVPADPATLRVYRWATEGSTPVVAYESPQTAFDATSNPLGVLTTTLSSTTLPATVVGFNVKYRYRLGDSMDVFTDPANNQNVTVLVSLQNPYSVGTTNDVPVTDLPNRNSYALLRTTNGGTSWTATVPSFSGSPVPSLGDFRLGLTFTDSDSKVFGSQGSSIFRYTTNSGASATLQGSPTFANISGNSRHMDYVEIGGNKLLAILDVGNATNTGPGTVRIYDVADPLNPVFLGSARAAGATNAVANGNATGSIMFGTPVGDTVKLYTLVTNNGVAAYTITVPEPTTLAALAGVTVMSLARRRKA